MQESALDRILACVKKWKFYSRIFNTFFVNSAKIKDSQRFIVIFWPIRYSGLLISNNYCFIHDEAVDRILVCVAK